MDILDLLATVVYILVNTTRFIMLLRCTGAFGSGIDAATVFAARWKPTSLQNSFQVSKAKHPDDCKWILYRS